LLRIKGTTTVRKLPGTLFRGSRRVGQTKKGGISGEGKEHVQEATRAIAQEDRAGNKTKKKTGGAAPLVIEKLKNGEETESSRRVGSPTWKSECGRIAGRESLVRGDRKRGWPL